jgi:hypothetical protein
VTTSPEAILCENCVTGYDGIGAVTRQPDGQLLCDECAKWKLNPAHDYSRFADELQELLKQKAHGKWAHIMGFSGGLDSTCALKLLVEEHGVRPLLAHIDNGFRPETVLRNITNIRDHYGLDLLILNRSVVAMIQAEFGPGTLFCGPDCTDRWLNPSLAEACEVGGFPYCLTGNEVVRRNSILRPGTPPRVDVMAAHLMRKDKQRAFIANLPWSDPGLYGYDSDCAYAGYGLDRYYKVHRSWPAIVIRHLSDRIRIGVLDRETELRRLLAGPCLSAEQDAFAVGRIAALPAISQRSP